MIAVFAISTASTMVAAASPSGAGATEQHIRITKVVQRNVPVPIEYVFDYECHGTRGDAVGTAVFDDPGGSGGIAIIGPLDVGDGTCVVVETGVAGPQSSCAAHQGVHMQDGVDSTLRCVTTFDPRPPPTEPPVIFPRPTVAEPPLPVLARKESRESVPRPPLPLPSAAQPATAVVARPRLAG